MTQDPNHPDDDSDMLDMDLNEEILDEDLDMLDAEELDGEWDDSAEEAAPAAKPKKKFSLFNIIVIGVAVLIGLGILASMGSKPDPNSQAPGGQMTSVPSLPPSETGAVDPNSLQAMQQDVPDTGATQTDTAPTAPTPDSSQGFMNDPSQLDQGTPSLPQAPSMTGFANAPQAPETPTSGNTNLPNINQIKKAELPVPGASPEIQSAPVASPTSAAPAPAPVAAVPAPTPIAAPSQPVTSAAPAADTGGILAKLDKMMSRMDSLEKKIDEKQAMTPAASSNSDIEELKTAVTRLEERVSKLSQSPVQSSAAVPSYVDEPSKVIVKKTVPKPKKKKISADENAAWSPAKSSASTSSTSTNWELRSARSGEAMISRSGGALQTVRVGDNVPGLGQIQSISQMGGSWVVRGSGGSVSQ